MQQVGVQLVAEGGDKYLQTLTQTAAAEAKVGAAAGTAVAGINALDDGSGSAAKSAQFFAEISRLAAQAAAKYGGESTEAAGDVAGLDRASDKAAGGVKDFGTAADKAGKEAQGLGDDAEKGSKGLNILQEMAVGAARKLGELVVNAAQQAGQAILDFTKETIGKAGDFEQGMNRFASVTGDALQESGQSLDDFKQLFISLGRELPVSTAEVQQAAIEMAKGGIEPATIAAGGLRDVLNLAAAGEVGIAEAAEIASKQLGVWVDKSATAEEKAKFLTQAVDLLSQAANASTVDVDDLALGLANTGKTADIAGLSFRETVTGMALISSGFSSAADAGTSFKTFLMRLTPTTDTQSDAFKRLNLLTSEGTSKFYDANGAFIGLDKAAQLLKESLDGLSPAQRKMALEAAFGADAIRAAGMLADAGAEGYAAMAAEMQKAGSAAAQAARKQQGFNVAVDNIMGSLEAFQITIGMAVLPALTSLINTLAGGLNAITDYADATIKGKTALSQIAGVVQSAAIPALVGLTAALITYAAVQVGTAAPATIAMIAKIGAMTTAFYANAAAVLAAMAPYALIAVAIGGMVWAYQNFTNAVATASTKLLESRQWWNDATVAIEDYGTQTGTAKEKLAPFATEITNIRSELQREIEDLGRRDAAGLVSEAQRATEMAHINSLAEALKRSTGAYNEQEQALVREAAAGMTATSQSQALQGATASLSGQVSLTSSDIENLGKAIQKTFEDGQNALNTYAQNYATFAAGVESRSAEFKDKMAALEQQKAQATTAEQKKGIDDQIAQLKSSYKDQEQAAAASYAAQQAAQQQHLGQMLIDYTVAQAELGNITKEKAAQVTAALEEEYGLQQSSNATTFLTMAGNIDKFATSADGSIDTLIGTLRENQQQAKDTQKAMDDYAKEYVATQTNNFLDGKADADTYIRALEKIPTQITTRVSVTVDENRTGPSQAKPGSGPEKRAGGGPMHPMESYITSERGPELITPTTASYVTPNDAARRAVASSAQMGALFGGGGAGASTIINVDARGSTMTEADVTRAVQAGLAAEGRMTDVRMRI